MSSELTEATAARRSRWAPGGGSFPNLFARLAAEFLDLRQPLDFLSGFEPGDKVGQRNSEHVGPSAQPIEFALGLLAQPVGFTLADLTCKRVSAHARERGVRLLPQDGQRLLDLPQLALRPLNIGGELLYGLAHSVPSSGSNPIRLSSSASRRSC